MALPFETTVDPVAPPGATASRLFGSEVPAAPPPAGLIPFYWYFIRQAKALFVLLFLLGIALATAGRAAPTGQPTGSVAGIPRVALESFAETEVRGRLAGAGAPGAMIVVVDRQGNRYERAFGTVDASGRLTSYVPVPTPGPRLPHDMIFTKNWAILNDMPVFWDAELLKRDIHAVRLHEGVPTRFALVPRDGELTLVAAWPPDDELDAAAMTAARWASTHNEPAGTGSATLPIIPWFFVPLRIGDKVLGVVGLGRGKNGEPLDSESRALFDTLVEQAAAAFDRALLARDMIDAKTATETERMRNTLLASVSLDFRTPLSSILGAATGLIDYGDKLAPAAQRDLLGQIRQEAEGLDEMVRNLLAIARIDAGALELRRDWLDLRDVVNRVVSAARRHGARQTLTVLWPDDVPLVRADATLAEQAIGNVVRNAVAHTGEETRIEIVAQADASTVAICVTDNGPGIPSETLPHLFDKFVRGPERSPQVMDQGATTLADGGEGTGLGLAIAKGILEAHGGRIEAQSLVADGRGARFVLTFPREAMPA